MRCCSVMMVRLVLMWLFLVGELYSGGIPEFRPPGEAQRRAALGDVSGMSAGWRRVLDATNFEVMLLPGEKDWLAKKQEFPQSLAAYAISKRPVISRRKRTVYLLPVGYSSGPGLAELEVFLANYVRLPVDTLAPVDLEELGLMPTEGRWGQEVLPVERVLETLRGRMPSDAFALVAVTGMDLHPGWKPPSQKSTRFVFGRARYSGRNVAPRVAVVSVARLDPEKTWLANPDAPTGKTQFFRRTAKVLAHETGHLLGLAHCAYYRCVMNGSAHLREADSRPAHLCPVCLRKMGTAVRFDPMRRYRDLAAVYENAGMSSEAEWVRKR